MISKITEIRKAIDPCKQYMNVEDYPQTLINAMGNLPTHINTENSLKFITQVANVCGITDYSIHQIKDEKFELDAEGTYECVPTVSCAYAIGIISRIVDGVYESISFYGDGSVIVSDVVDEAKVYYYFQMSN